ncbi:hypothetical protein [Azospirillum canadense]|uniref:hypothetical protein n=1 Tax=Azospirillum canadense TaxID=403962 RepID=UPI002227D4B1|nr:hypothetical protein [Azospirillum canadense]MCW2242217.1 hypothetical protein [Azospirillum canadense]
MRAPLQSMMVFITVPWLAFSVTHVQAETKAACSVDAPPASCAGLFAVDATGSVPATEKLVNTPNPKCGDGRVFDYVGILKDSLAKMVDAKKMADASADLAKATVHFLSKEAKDKLGGDIATGIWRNFSEKTNEGNCITLSVIVPNNAEVVGYRIVAGESGGSMNKCQVGLDCGVGYSRFLREPVAAIEEQGVKSYMTTFMNWAHDRQRDARLVIFFKTIDGKPPPIAM